MAYFRKVEPSQKSIQRVDGEEHRLEYNKLMTLWRIAEHGDAIRSIVINAFQLSGVWGVEYATWKDFVTKELHTSESQAMRLRDEGAVASRLLSKDPFLIELKSRIGALDSVFLQKYDKNYHGGSFTQETAEITHLPPLKSARAPIAMDRKMLRMIGKAPMDKWEAIADEASATGKATSATVRAAVEKHAPPTVAKKPRPRASDPMVDPGETYRDTMTHLGTELTKTGKLRDAAIAETGASVIAATIQSLRMLAKTIRGWQPSKSEVPF